MSDKKRNDHIDPYDREAAQRAAEYDSIDPAQMYEPLLPLLPKQGAKALDIGAGAGRDALWLESMGYSVVAIEPARGLRMIMADKAQRGAGRISVRDGMLPKLDTVKNEEKFDLILLSAVWQHVAPRQRRAAFNKVAGHLKEGGMVYMLLRQGPAPAGRKMYPVSDVSLKAYAADLGLELVETKQRQKDLLNRGDVRWTVFAARRPAR
jgi:2-polyprenyl-3-methyl-5-hydroxy-6-metoxy-1,4-benzoquinol methylase